jgi:geranylgeranylglycerol-phosphate geranylgeranyltransferase
MDINRKIMGIQQKAKAMIQLIRPELPIAAGVCVVVGQVIAFGQFPAITLVVLGFLLGFTLSSSAMVFNDYFDLEVDRINSPQRPYAAGLLSRSEMSALGGMMAAVGLAVSLGIHPIVFVLSLIIWMMGFLYNWRLKASGLWGNLIVSANVAMTFILGGISEGRAATPMVWIFGLMGYWVPIMVTNLLILFFAYKLVKSLSPQEGRGAMRGLYLSATLGLIAFIIGSYVR